MRNLIYIVSLLTLISCGRREKDPEQSAQEIASVSQPNVQSDSGKVEAEKDSMISINQQNKPEISPNSIRSNIFRNVNVSGFGYDILIGEKLYIHQPNVPAVPGNNGFETEEAAQKVAELVIYKVRNNIMPPTVNIEELDSLGVIYSKK